MSKLPTLTFSAHARLKDIVGRGLIISDNIAIIELIKNSKDAGASGVRIDFRQAGNSEATELVISDDGHGMTMEDIEHKWLNIAYSEKKTTAPKSGAYAGSKGIGRFSCDRLGIELDICGVPDEYLVHTRRPLLMGREVLKVTLAHWSEIREC